MKMRLLQGKKQTNKQPKKRLFIDGGPRVIGDRLKENGRRAKEDLRSARVCAGARNRLSMLSAGQMGEREGEREQKGVRESG